MEKRTGAGEKKAPNNLILDISKALKGKKRYILLGVLIIGLIAVFGEELRDFTIIGILGGAASVSTVYKRVIRIPPALFTPVMRMRPSSTKSWRVGVDIHCVRQPLWNSAGRSKKILPAKYSRIIPNPWERTF